MRRVAAIVIALAAGCGRLGFGTGDDGSDGDAKIIVEITGDGVTVTSEPPGIDCPTDCDALFATGTTVTLTATADAEAWFQGWTGACGGRTACRLVVDGDRDVIALAKPLPNRIFITSTTQTGALGGIAGADTICAVRASEAGLAGTFIAYLSSAAQSVEARLAGSRGWIRVDGTPVTDSLTSKEVFEPVALDELGGDARTRRAYTASFSGAYSQMGDCNAWTAADPGLTTHTSTMNVGNGLLNTQSTSTCDAMHGLLCVEIGRDVAVGPVPPAGATRIAFLTTAPWASGGGRADADARCAGDAAAAGFPGTYLAALATTTSTIASRFDLNGPPWIRPDGQLIAPTAAGVFSDPIHVAAIDIGTDQLNASVFHHYTGARSPFDVGTAATTCDDWTSTASAQSGWIGYSTQTRNDLIWGYTPEPCDLVDKDLICLQE